MRVDLRKHLFVGHSHSLDAFFLRAQELGLIHFIDRRKRRAEVDERVKKITGALKTLRGLPLLKQVRPETRGEAQRIAADICRLHDEIEGLNERIRLTRLKIARNAVFGYFSLEDIRFIERSGNRKIQFFFAKKGRFRKNKMAPELFFIDSLFGLDYFIAINRERKRYEHMVEMKIEDELATLRRDLAELCERRRCREQELKGFAKYRDYLYAALVEALNDFRLNEARGFVEEEMEGRLFAVSGWVPKNKEDKLRKLTDNTDVFAARIAPDKEETSPTYLENREPAKIGEDLVQLYDTPSNEDRDPSLWVLCSFALFFAMIVGDGGYGLIFLAAAIYARYKKGRFKGVVGRVWKLSIILSSFCIIWGVFANSFFGMKLSRDNPLREYSVTNWLMEKKATFHFDGKDDVYQEWADNYSAVQRAKDGKEFLYSVTREKGGRTVYVMVESFSDSILMELSIFVGMAHIIFSLLRYSDKIPSGIGWTMAIVGVYFYLTETLRAYTLFNYAFGWDRSYWARQGYYMMLGGFSLSLLLGIIRDKLYGLLEITKVIQIFADILSYLRLYALALAGSIISSIVNEVAGSIFLMGGGVILLMGHGLNMLLSATGGIIHGLRLNFIEWYHYSFFGGGKRFDPLRKIKIE